MQLNDHLLAYSRLEAPDPCACERQLRTARKTPPSVAGIVGSRLRPAMAFTLPARGRRRAL